VADADKVAEVSSRYQHFGSPELTGAPGVTSGLEEIPSSQSRHPGARVGENIDITTNRRAVQTVLRATLAE
jgi:hypothetical protein